MAGSQRITRITRRQLLVTAGSGVLGLAVVSTVTGCSGASSSSSSSSASSVSRSAPSSPSAADSASGGLAWHRVSLSFVSAYLLVRGQEVAVVDTGTAGSGDAIGSGLVAAGLGWNAIRHIVLTHQHPDHVGGLSSVAPHAQSATVYAGQADVAAIPAPSAAAGAAARPITPLANGAEVFGLRVIGTPGHTLGHLSVFDPATGVLVAGDALRTTSGLQGSDPQFTASTTDAVASVKKLASLDVRVILPGHGDPLTSGAADALRKLAATL
jgi:glyoxylase-like metal-dependent hydrolase (beta-lactamase superfamily II)